MISSRERFLLSTVLAAASSVAMIILLRANCCCCCSCFCHPPLLFYPYFFFVSFLLLFLPLLLSYYYYYYCISYFLILSHSPVELNRTTRVRTLCYSISSVSCMIGTLRAGNRSRRWDLFVSQQQEGSFSLLYWRDNRFC
jgi:hypothetical protein